MLEAFRVKSITTFLLSKKYNTKSSLEDFVKKITTLNANLSL
jgi:hypothetical protein